MLGKDWIFKRKAWGFVKVEKTHLVISFEKSRWSRLCIYSPSWVLGQWGRIAENLVGGKAGSAGGAQHHLGWVGSRVMRWSDKGINWWTSWEWKWSKEARIGEKGKRSKRICRKNHGSRCKGCSCPHVCQNYNRNDWHVELEDDRGFIACIKFTPASDARFDDLTLT